MSYEAIVAATRNIRPHSNADRLNLSTVCGYQIIVGKDQEEGQLGVFFASDGCLSPSMAEENNLYHHTYLNKDKEATPGFFSDNRRVRAMKLRGEISEGFWCPLKSFEWTGADLTKLKEGDTFTELNGHLICEKYFTPATKAAMNKGPRDKKGMKQRLADSFREFKTHWDVPKLRHMIGTIPEGSLISISEKCHGCVDKDTEIETLEHGVMRIQEIVEKKLEVHIKSFNTEKKEVEYAPVEGWYFYADDGDWYELEMEEGTKVMITGNNPVWIPDLQCYRKVEDLKEGDALLITEK